MEINLLGEAMRLVRLESQAEREHWRGVARQTLKKGLENNLDHIPVKGRRDMGTATVASWDLTKSRGVDPTPRFDPETGKRIS